MAFTAGTLSDIDACVTEVQGNINRGTLSTSTKPTLLQVQHWLIRAKQELAERHNFTWRRVFSYINTVSDTYRYALPPDFGYGGYILRDTTQDERLTPIDTTAFDTLFPDVAGESTDSPGYYTIKGNEIWLAAPASGVNRLELEYDRTGDDTSPNDVSYIPELMRFRICDYATYRSFIALQRFDAASAYKGEWDSGMATTTKADSKKRWKAQGYKVRTWFV